MKEIDDFPFGHGGPFTLSSKLLEGDVDDLLAREWLITNNLGGYASSSLINCNTRKYHGVLIAANRPPISRVVGVSNFVETAYIDGGEICFSSFEFNNIIHPEGFRYIRGFKRDITDELSCVWFVYKYDDLTMIKSIWLFSGYNVAFVYWFLVTESLTKKIRFKVQPLLAMRDHHSLRRKGSVDPFEIQVKQNRLHIVVPTLGRDQLDEFYQLNLIPAGLRSPVDVSFMEYRDWWYNFRYRREAERGYDCGEDLYTPGYFEAEFLGRGGFGIWVDMEDLPLKRFVPLLKKVNEYLDTRSKVNIVDDKDFTYMEALQDNRNPLLEPPLETLDKAASQFIVKRKIRNRSYSSIIAGYHWFSDWARDAFISMEGLLLDRGRLAEAKELIILFGSYLKDGLIPNCFDDYSGEPLYNSIDATLWYLYSADLYIEKSGDIEFWKKHLQKIAISIFESFMEGTVFDIKVDPQDGLLSAGNKDTQLTWMDAKFEDRAFTPRYGKAVEINALWYNFLKILLKRLDGRKKKLKGRLEQVLNLVETNFREKFWYDEGRYLYDCVREDFSDSSVRPNQIFAVALKESPLDSYQQNCVVEKVRRELLTPFGLRSLSPSDPGYRGRYEGTPYERDASYHQGTVWAWLLGPFVVAYLKVNKYSATAANIAKEWLRPILEKHLYEAGIGTISEIFDADPPHLPRGCIAQAWSVGQIYHAIVLLNNILSKQPELIV